MAKGVINAVKRFFGRITNMTKKGDAATADLIDKVKKAYDTDIETARNAIKALQTAFNEATKSDALLKNKNTTKDGGVKHSAKENKTKSQLNIDNAEQSSYNNTKNGGQQNGRQQNDGNRVVGGLDQGISKRQVSDRTEASERHGDDGRGHQEFPGILRISSELDKAYKQSGVVATELYDYSGDSAAYSYALDEARKPTKRMVGALLYKFRRL